VHMRIAKIIGALAVAAGVSMAAAPAALAAPPVGSTGPYFVSKASLISQGYTCGPSSCTKSGFTLPCNATACWLPAG
jgi:hypothetical protein